jgi:tetratricopeptide (TPR) repeat protein
MAKIANLTKNMNYRINLKWQNRLTLVATCLVYLVAIVLSFKAIKEPDLWWQLATGDWILANKSIPTTDVFSFTYFGVKWINIKWGFEVLIALWTKLFGVTSIYIIQALVSVALVYFSIKLVALFNNQFLNKPFSNSVIAIFLLAYLAAISSRIIGRPEMFTHLFTLVFIYVINKFKNKKQLIYLLAPMQLIWTNMREAFSIGVVIISIYTVADWFVHFKYKTVKPLYLSISLIFSIVSIVINPYGFEMLGRPLEIFSQLNNNKFTTELSNYTTHEYWQFSSYYSLILLILVSLGLAISLFNIKLKGLITEYGLGNILILYAFTILAGSAFRNVVFLQIILLPFIIRLTFKLLQFIGSKITFKLPIAFTLATPILLGFCFYLAVISNYFYTTNNDSNTYGLQFSSSQNPVGAAQFLKDNKLADQIIFTDYLSSSYLLYKLTPQFKTFIDLRDFDVFPDSFFYQNAGAYNDYNEFKQLDNQYHFKAAVILNSQFKKLQTGLYNDSDYTLKYFDPLVSVFVKTRKTSDLILPITKLLPTETNKFCLTLNYLFNPFYKAIDKTKIDYTLETAKFYLSVGNFKTSHQLVNNNDVLSDNLAIKSYISSQYFINKAITDTSNKLAYNDSDRTCLNNAIKLNSNYFEAYFSLGVIALNQGNFTNAAKQFEKCCKLESDNLNAHLYAGECYKALVENNQALKYLPNFVLHLEIANEMNPNNPNIEWNLGVAYFKQGKCNLSTPILLKVKNFEGLTADDKNIAVYCITNCGNK